ncbi:MAG: serpin family protein [Bacteroidales bacterium]|nr:serpin family protein [Bacteroidales bacterium]
MEVELTSMPDMQYFIASKPFLFAIVEKQSGSIVFIGKMAKPEYE